jgi:hypothetical protein
VTVLLRGRSEDVAFRQRLGTTPSILKWTFLYALADDNGHVVDELFVCDDDHVHSEGYRLLWYRSTRKAEQDKSRRTRSIQKATEALSDLRDDCWTGPPEQTQGNWIRSFAIVEDRVEALREYRQRCHDRGVIERQGCRTSY